MLGLSTYIYKHDLTVCVFFDLRDFADSPAASLGIKEGDAHVIRNAGGIA